MRHSRSGFTLIELLVVIAIIGILASVVLASLNSARQKARDNALSVQVEQVKTALEVYYLEFGRYPYPSASCANIDTISELAPFIDISSMSYLRYARVSNGNGYTIRVDYEDTDTPGTNSAGVCITGVNMPANPCNWSLGSYVCQSI